MYYAKTEATMNLDDLKAYKLVRKENLSDIRSTSPHQNRSKNNGNRKR